MPHRVAAHSPPRRTQHRHVESTMCDHTYSFWSSSLKRDRSSTIAVDKSPPEPIRVRPLFAAHLREEMTKERYTGE